MFEKTGLLRQLTGNILLPSLRANFVRPKSLPAIQSLLAKTGSPVGFLVTKDSVYRFISIPRYRLRERSDAIQAMREKTGLLRRLTGNILLPSLRANIVRPKSLPAIWSLLAKTG